MPSSIFGKTTTAILCCLNLENLLHTAVVQSFAHVVGLTWIDKQPAVTTNAEVIDLVYLLPLRRAAKMPDEHTVLSVELHKWGTLL